MRFMRASSSQIVMVDPKRHRIGAGGEGTVYSVDGDLAAKIYKSPEPRREKILAMLANPPTDNSTPDHDSIAWPIDALIEPGPSRRFVGYLMKRVDKAGGFRDVAHFKNRRTKRPHFTNYELHVVALNIASAFSALHKKGYVVGDVNDRNILVTELGLATLLDTDSFQVPRQRSGGCFRCTVKTPEFTPPELQKANPRNVDRRIEHDLFGLAVLIFQLLMLGNHPFNGTDDEEWSIPTRIEKGNFPFGRRQRPIRPPRHAPSLNVLGDELGELFVRCFDDGASDPSARPAATTWRKALDRARQNLVTCNANDNHRYPASAAQCPWCRIRREITLSNGEGLDYFPDAHAQIPLSKPARGTVLGGSQRSGSSGISQPAAALPAHAATAQAAPRAAASSASTSSAGSNPTLADLALKALGAMASAYLGNVIGGGQTRAAGAGPQDGIVPGRWEFRLVTPVPPMAPGPLLLGGQLNLGANGTFGGSGMLLNMYVRSPCQLSGQWQYDAFSKKLRVSTVVNGMPIGHGEELQVMGAGGQLQVMSNDGRQFVFRRLS